MTEYYKKYRPHSFDDVLGQATAVKTLDDMVERKDIPHAMLFSGPSGCGKTTMIRILRRELGCGKIDYQEVNCGLVDKPLDAVRGVQARMGLAPVSGPCRVWCLDEVQSLGRARFAQEALLKILEDMPEHVYFFLATTDPSKLIPTVRNRCTDIKLSPISGKVIGELVAKVVKAEELDVSKEVVSRITEVADGSARKALVLLHQISGLNAEEEMLKAVLSSDTKRQAIEVARVLMNPKAKWKDVAAMVKDVDDDPETVRRLVLSYASSVLTNGGGLSDRAYMILTAFEGSFFDSGRAGLVRACWEVNSQK